VTLPIRQAWLESIAVDLDEVKNASRELNLKVQIVSRAPEQLAEPKLAIWSLNLARTGRPHGFRPCAIELEDTHKRRAAASCRNRDARGRASDALEITVLSIDCSNAVTEGLNHSEWRS
jgi:hypothetical protein